MNFQFFTLTLLWSGTGTPRIVNIPQYLILKILLHNFKHYLKWYSTILSFFLFVHWVWNFPFQQSLSESSGFNSTFINFLPTPFITRSFTLFEFFKYLLTMPYYGHPLKYDYRTTLFSIPFYHSSSNYSLNPGSKFPRTSRFVLCYFITRLFYKTIRLRLQFVSFFYKVVTVED